MGDPNGAQAMEEASRVAAEEDKRRRNTAASARFRVKKKQREQALEKTAKEMTERVAELEAENQQLRLQNKWYKDILKGKCDKTSADEDVSIVKEDSRLAESKDAAPKDGVGTDD